jgi:hypothetical protein
MSTVDALPVPSTPERLIEGLVVPFNRWLEVNNSREGHFMERFLPGSLRKSFGLLRRVKGYFDHGQSRTFDRAPILESQATWETPAGASSVPPCSMVFPPTSWTGSAEACSEPSRSMLSAFASPGSRRSSPRRLSSAARAKATLPFRSPAITTAQGAASSLCRNEPDRAPLVGYPSRCSTKLADSTRAVTRTGPQTISSCEGPDREPRILGMTLGIPLRQGRSGPL